jgi:hypothetical protein
MDILEKLATYGTQEEEKQKQNTICVTGTAYPS